MNRDCVILGMLLNKQLFESGCVKTQLPDGAAGFLFWEENPLDNGRGFWYTPI